MTENRKNGEKENEDDGNDRLMIDDGNDGDAGGWNGGMEVENKVGEVWKWRRGKRRKNG